MSFKTTSLIRDTLLCEEKFVSPIEFEFEINILNDQTLSMYL